jgi:hypothetical protein
MFILNKAVLLYCRKYVIPVKDSKRHIHGTDPVVVQIIILFFN